MDNNFVIKLNVKEENIIIDENLLENVNVILFIFDEINENFLTKIKSFYDKITKIKKETITTGIIAFKDSIKNEDVSKSIQELSKSLNIFFEEEEEEVFDIKDILQKIKNKYLNNYENKIIENEEGTFFGKDTNNKKEGYGMMLYKNGSMYFGEWEDDLKKGNRILYDDGNIYKGEWNNNELISGEIRYFFNIIFEGKFLNSELYEGKVKYLDLITYEGTLKEEYLYGKVEIKNGNLYEGKCENFSNDFYREILCEGKGEGTIKYANNDVYKGKWSKFKKNGKGIIYTEDGDIFESEWKNDVIVGNWMFKSNNGDIVIGEIIKDEENKKKDIRDEDSVDEENQDEEIIDEDIIDEEIDFNLVDVKKYNLEEKINIIEKYWLGFENIENFEIYDDEIIKVEYDIQYIYKIWKIGKNISKYINEGKKILFFKEFLQSSFKSNKNFKIIKKIERILKIINYAKKYAILYNKKNVIYDANQNLEIIEKNFTLFNEIIFFKGMISEKGVDIEKIKK